MCRLGLWPIVLINLVAASDCFWDVEPWKFEKNYKKLFKKLFSGECNREKNSFAVQHTVHRILHRVTNGNGVEPGAE